MWEGRRRAAVGRGAEMGDPVRPEGEGPSIIHFFSLVWLFQCLFPRLVILWPGGSFPLPDGAPAFHPHVLLEMTNGGKSLATP